MAYRITIRRNGTDEIAIYTLERIALTGDEAELLMDLANQANQLVPFSGDAKMVEIMIEEQVDLKQQS